MEHMIFLTYSSFQIIQTSFFNLPLDRHFEFEIRYSKFEIRSLCSLKFEIRFRIFFFFFFDIRRPIKKPLINENELISSMLDDKFGFSNRSLLEQLSNVNIKFPHVLYAGLILDYSPVFFFWLFAFIHVTHYIVAIPHSQYLLL